MVPSLTPYDLSFPQNGGSICPQHTRMAISLQRVIRSTSCLVLGQGFRGRRIERRYLRFEQIQDGGHRHVGKISSGDISATGRPIHIMFCSRVGFSGSADLMAAAILEKFQIAISPQPVVYLRNGSRSTYIARIARSFAIAQLSCINMQ